MRVCVRVVLCAYACVRNKVCGKGKTGLRVGGGAGVECEGWGCEAEIRGRCLLERFLDACPRVFDL